MHDSEWNVGEHSLLRASDGRDIITATELGPAGCGRLVEIHSALSQEPGGLLAEPAFVVLFNELCRYASPGPALPTPARPGDPLPTGVAESHQLIRPAGADADSDRLTAPGAYLLLGPQGELIEGVWCEHDPAESDTQNVTDWRITNDSRGRGLGKSDAAVSSALRRDAYELWPYMGLGALLLAAGESLLVWRFASAEGGAA